MTTSTPYGERYPGNSISPLAWIHPDVQIGRGNIIGPFCMIGGPAEYKGHEVQGRVIIGDNNTITGLVSIDSGTDGFTVMTNGCYVMKHAHVGHDAIIEVQVTLSCGAKIGGHAVINAFANIGLNAVIHQKQIIMGGCMIGMGAVVTKKLITEPFKIYAGNPAKYIGENINHPKYQYTESETAKPETSAIFVKLGAKQVHIRDLFLEIFKLGLTAHQSWKDRPDRELQVLFDGWLNEKIL